MHTSCWTLTQITEYALIITYLTYCSLYFTTILHNLSNYHYISVYSHNDKNKIAAWSVHFKAILHIFIVKYNLPDSCRSDFTGDATSFPLKKKQNNKTFIILHFNLNSFLKYKHFSGGTTF